MMSSPYFFLIISFLGFIYVIYKKLMPTVDENLSQYRQQIAGKLLDLEEEYTTLEERLNEVTQDLSGVQQIIDGIFLDLDEKIRRLSETSTKKNEELMRDMEKNAIHNMQKLKTKAEKEFLMEITNDLDGKLMKWAEDKSASSQFQKASVLQSFLLLKNVVQK